MDSRLTPELGAAANAAFEAAIAVRGSQEAFAALVGRSQGAISKRLASGKGLWAEDVLKVEAATGISRHRLRPDLYPDESTAGTHALDHAAAPPDIGAPPPFRGQPHRHRRTAPGADAARGAEKPVPQAADVGREVRP